MEPQKPNPDMTGSIEAEERSLIWKIKETLRITSWGQTIAKYVQIWGLNETVAFGLGALIVIGVTYFGMLPNFLISDGYKAKVIVGPKPKEIAIAPIKSLPEFYQPYTYWLEQEAQSLKNQGLIKGFMACSVSSQEMRASAPFDWILKASPSFEISGRAFRIAKDGSILPLDATSKESSAIKFNIPSLADGDRLLAIVTILGKETEPADDCIEFINSSII